MDQLWTNYSINSMQSLPNCNSLYPKSVHLQPVPPVDSSSNLNVVNNCWNFNPRAYVNPKLVSCVYPFAKLNNGTISNKIHINPNFKGSYHQSKNGQPKCEGNSFHINPHFCLAKANLNTVNKQSIENLPVNTSSFVDEENIKISEPEERTQDLIEKKSSTCYASGNFQLSANTSNSTYYWSKQNSLPAFENVLMSGMKSESGSYKKAGPTKFAPLYKSNIKTKHKIVNGVSSSSNTHKGNEIMVCKIQHQNPYKIVNIDGKSRFDNCQKSKLKERNKSLYSKSNLIESDGDKKSALGVKKFQAGAKLKVSNINQSLYVNKITNLIRTKYMYLNKRKQLKIINVGNYKLDKRKKNMILRKRNTNVKNLCDGIAVSFAKSTLALKDGIWKSVFSKKINKFKPVSGMVWRKKGSLEKDLQRIGQAYQNKTVVNIGGIMYKSSINKLTRTKDKKETSHQLSTKPFLTSCKTNHVVYVRGEKFLLGEGGKTLIRQFKSGDPDGSKKCSVRRVDIGGVTYIQKSNNILIQTKTHQARHFVNYAKQRSIAVLSNLHKRNNKPCMIYQKFGICRRHSRGMCIYVHDPRNIALCKKFLKGDCKESNCLLSHDIVKEKVATCHFFLKGNCQRENCPFLHVKVNKKAAICVDFLQGFCALGQNCKKRHIHQCPDFDENDSCPRGVKCPYPHRKIKRKTKDGTTYKVSKFKLTENRARKAEERKIEGKTKKRGKKKPKTVKRKIKTDESFLQESCNDSTIECIPKRVKLDHLPLFIPLNT